MELKEFEIGDKVLVRGTVGSKHYSTLSIWIRGGAYSINVPLDALEADDSKPESITPVLQWDDPALQAEIANAAKGAGEKMEAIKGNKKIQPIHGPIGFGQPQSSG